MNFEEIFKENGLYTSDDFAEGFCFEVFGLEKSLMAVQYKDANDLLPDKHRALVYEGLFKKTYRKVFTRQSLFKNKNNENKR